MSIAALLILVPVALTVYLAFRCPVTGVVKMSTPSPLRSSPARRCC